MEKGTRLGPYEILGKLAAGGMATVFIARHVRLGHVVGIKILHPHYQQDEQLRVRFVDEARIQANLRHPNILGVQDILELPEASGMVMELLEGCTLSGYYKKVEKPLSYARATGLFLRLADAIAYAHSMAIVHRDLKPSNVYLHRVQSEAVPKLMDFGIAKLQNLAATSQLTAAGSLLGTPQYMAPEQFEDSSAVDTQADIYALGVMMYEAATGVLPFQGATIPEIMTNVLNKEVVSPSELREDFPPSLEEVILRCLKREKSSRYETAVQLLGALEAAGEEIGVETIQASTLPDADVKITGIDIATKITSDRKQKSTAQGKPDGETLSTVEDALPKSGVGDESWVYGGDVKTHVKRKVSLPLLLLGLVGVGVAVVVAVSLAYMIWKGKEGAEDSKKEGVATEQVASPGRVATEESPTVPTDEERRIRRPPASLSEVGNIEEPVDLSDIPTQEGLALGGSCPQVLPESELIRYMNARLSAGWCGRRLSSLGYQQLSEIGVSPEVLENMSVRIGGEELVKEMARLASRSVAPFKEQSLSVAHLVELDRKLSSESNLKEYLEAKVEVLCRTMPATAAGDFAGMGRLFKQVLAARGLDSAVFADWDNRWDGDPLVRAEANAKALCCLLKNQ